MTSASPLVVPQPITSSVSSGPAVSIFSLAAICTRQFQELIGLLRATNDVSETLLNLEDEVGRFRVWMGNLGAHRKQTDRLSLDHRLREAPALHSEVQNHLVALKDAIEKVILISSIDTSPQPHQDSSSEDSDSDEEWKAFIMEENQEYNELGEYLLDVHHTITSLYKLSITLQNPARRDRTDKAAQIDLRHFEYFDIQHVSDKFGLSRESPLVQRLGKANTRRRQLILYHQEHSDRISKYVDVAMEKARPTADPSIQPPKSISTKWTQNTTVSTVHQVLDTASDSGRTKFSITTSTANDQISTLLPPPPLPSLKKDQPKKSEPKKSEPKKSEPEKIEPDRNEPFFCPYCCETIQLANPEEDWKYHVLSDLRPYICTFGNCVKEDQLYDSYTEWKEHERQFHRRQFLCDLCLFTCDSVDKFRAHLQASHKNEFPQTHLETIIESSWRSSAAPQHCPLCNKSPIANPNRFQQHLARHLQQLALFVLPRHDPEDEPKHGERDSNESQQVLVMDDEEISFPQSLSFRSTSNSDDSESVKEKRFTGLAICCSCGNMVNLALSPDICPICSHKLCASCEGPEPTPANEEDSQEQTEQGGSSARKPLRANRGPAISHAEVDFDSLMGPNRFKQPNPAQEKTASIHFTDGDGMKFRLPLKLCSTWEGMKDCIERIYFNDHDETITAHVVAGNYGLVDRDGEEILPQEWEDVIQAESVITMQMWPLLQKPAIVEPLYEINSQQVDGEAKMSDPVKQSNYGAQIGINYGTVPDDSLVYRAGSQQVHEETETTTGFQQSNSGFQIGENQGTIDVNFGSSEPK